MNMSAPTPTIPVEGRICGDCAMCCKIPIIPELDKPYNSWCTHCVGNKSCGIYETRPVGCREFYCYFMVSDLGEAWRPNKCRMIVTATPEQILVMVDPARPDIWREEVYFSTIRHWSTQAEVHVKVGKITYVIFPDHIDDLGEVTDDHQIMIITEQTITGPRARAMRVLKSEMVAGH